MAKAIRGVSGFSSAESAQRFAIQLAIENVRNQTGGPFGALVCEKIGKRFKLLSAGVNCVVGLNDPTAHAEITAIRSACAIENSFDLSHGEMRSIALFSSAQPCFMCLGAILWSGTSELYYSADKKQVERFGFLEGPLPDRWQAEAKKLGVTSHRIRLNDELVPFKNYETAGGIIYNGFAGPSKR